MENVFFFSLRKSKHLNKTYPSILFTKLEAYLESTTAPSYV
jgi:hypothetical protein